MRHLRTYQHVAQKDHWCDRCCRHIMPGEMYEGSVEISDSHGLIVFKTHVYPSCEFPDPPEDCDEEEGVLEESVKEPAKEEFREAA